MINFVVIVFFEGVLILEVGLYFFDGFFDGFGFVVEFSGVGVVEAGIGEEV